METSHQKALSWIPWNKLNNLMPIKKNQMGMFKTLDPSPVSYQVKSIYLPKLNVKKLCVSLLRQKSPTHYDKRIRVTKVFSPVLRRGGTVETSRANSKEIN